MPATLQQWQIVVKTSVFYLGLSTLFTHELDAMPNHEWRMLPILQSLPDAVAMEWFVAAHVPLFAIIVALVSSKGARTRTLSRLGISGFLVIHGVLHALSVGQPHYQFSSTLSNLLIFGGAILGVVYLTFEAKDKLASAGPAD